MYQREDIYYCDCCAEFYDLKTNQKVEVEFSEMPVCFAAQVRKKRQKLAKQKNRRPHT